METLSINEDDTLNIVPSELSSSSDFDFYKGNWKIKNRRLKERLNNCTEWTEFEATQEMQIILHGIGNHDSFIAVLNGKPFEGRTLRLFDPITRLWSMYWTDSESGILQPPTIGSFNGSMGKFFANDVFNDRPIIVMFVWDKTDPNNPTWSQAFSEDNGLSWEYNWYMFMTRI